MSRKVRHLLLILIAVATSVGCSTTTTKNKIFRDMAIGAAAGALIAQTKSHHRNTYTTMYSSMGAVMAGVGSVYFNLPKTENLQQENDELKVRLEQFEKQLQPQLVDQGSSLFSSPIPKEVSGLVDPGEWKRYKLDQWVQDPHQSNTWYRQVEMFEIIPPVSK